MEKELAKDKPIKNMFVCKSDEGFLIIGMVTDEDQIISIILKKNDKNKYEVIRIES